MNNKVIRCDEKTGKAQVTFDFSRIIKLLESQELEFTLGAKYYYRVKLKPSNDIEFLLWDKEFDYGYSLIVNPNNLGKSSVHEVIRALNSSEFFGNIYGREFVDKTNSLLLAFTMYLEENESIGSDERFMEGKKLLEFLVEYQSWKNRLRIFFSDAYIRITDASLLLGRLG